MSSTTPLQATQAWFEKAVIGLNLCPFAKAVHVRSQIRWVHCPAQDAEVLLQALVDELQVLAAADPQQIETTMLVHPYVLQDFADYNDFLDLADAALAELGLEGELQIASFHPEYQFADTAADDMGNCSNRSPYPTLHLLRESSIERALESTPDAAQIYERNIRTLQALGPDGWQRLLADEG